MRESDETERGARRAIHAPAVRGHHQGNNQRRREERRGGATNTTAAMRYGPDTRLGVRRSVEVAVDCDYVGMCGRGRVHQSCHEIGKASPVIAAGNRFGGRQARAGLGWAMLEEVGMARRRMANAQLTNYIVPTTLDTPRWNRDLENQYPGRAVRLRRASRDADRGPAPRLINRATPRVRYAGEIPAAYRRECEFKTQGHKGHKGTKRTKHKENNGTKEEKYSDLVYLLALCVLVPLCTLCPLCDATDPERPPPPARD